MRNEKTSFQHFSEWRKEVCIKTSCWWVVWKTPQNILLMSCLKNSTKHLVDELSEKLHKTSCWWVVWKTPQNILLMSCLKNSTKHLVDELSEKLHKTSCWWVVWKTPQNILLMRLSEKLHKTSCWWVVWKTPQNSINATTKQENLTIFVRTSFSIVLPKLQSCYSWMLYIWISHICLHFLWSHSSPTSFVVQVKAIY